jgi:carbon monoxide dehydrogenase subunit G
LPERRDTQFANDPACLSDETVFGGTSPLELAAALDGGFAVWVDTDECDERIVQTQGAMMARAPMETVYETITDFENAHRFVGVARRNKIHHRSADHIDVTLKQGIGLGPISLGLAERFRFRLQPPNAVCCEAYLDGPFSHARLEWRLFEVDAHRTLIVMSFLADVTELGGLVRTFFDKQPELGFAVSGHVVIIPLTSYVDEAERRVSQNHAAPRSPPRPIPEALGAGLLGPALEHGYLTVGRLDAHGGLIDISCATRVGASPEALWPAIEDPRVLGDVISFISDAELRRLSPTEIQQRLEYKIRFGPLKKRYTYKRRAQTERPLWTRTVEADLDGHPVLQNETLWADGQNTKLCQVHSFDLKSDWLSNIFLRRHPEFERLIATYSPNVFVRSVRRLLGSPIG